MYVYYFLFTRFYSIINYKFIFQVGGRLANKMFGYAFLLALKLKYGFRVFLEGRHLEHLSYFYENIDQVESLDDLCDEGNSFPWTNSTEIWTDLGKPELKTGQCMDYYKNVSKYVTLGKLIYPEDDDGVAGFRQKDQISGICNPTLSQFRAGFGHFLPKKCQKLQNSDLINPILL